MNHILTLFLFSFISYDHIYFSTDFFALIFICECHFFHPIQLQYEKKRYEDKKLTSQQNKNSWKNAQTQKMEWPSVFCGAHSFAFFSFYVWTQKQTNAYVCSPLNRVGYILQMNFLGRICIICMKICSSFRFEWPFLIKIL